MPEQTPQAIEWALQQEFDGEPVTVDNPHGLVHWVGEYFNMHSIPYGTFSFDDLVPYLPGAE